MLVSQLLSDLKSAGIELTHFAERYASEEIQSVSLRKIGQEFDLVVISGSESTGWSPHIGYFPRSYLLQLLMVLDLLPMCKDALPRGEE